MQPLSRGGPDEPGNLVTICANAHGNVHYLLSAIERARGYDNLSADYRRSFGAGVRRIALAGWLRYEAAYLGGRLWREIDLWDTDGRGLHPDVPPYSWAARTVGHLTRELPVTAHEPYVEWVRARSRR